jgi:hypothetical protein
VHVPVLARVIQVSHCDMLVYNDGILETLSDAEFESSFAELKAAQALWPWRAADRKLAVEFESPPQQDRAELRGKYRLGPSEKGRFVFSKRNQPRSTYHFSMSAAANDGLGKLEYLVPIDCVLNREFVMLALSEILHAEPPPGFDEQQFTG